MIKPTLIFFSLLILLSNVGAHSIGGLGNLEMDPEGNQVFEIMLDISEKITEHLEFKMTLQNTAGDEKIATCSYDPIDSEEEIKDET